jgi:hypothetical membrane protein
MAFLANPIWFKLLGFAGAAIALLGSVIAGAAYRGKAGERYSPFNHFISELGEEGVSQLAPVFNISLFLSGLALLLATLSLGLLLPGFLAKLGLAAGVVSAVSLALVGVFPMNKMNPHGKAAVTYFRTGLAMVALFSLAIAFQPDAGAVLSHGVALAGVPTVLSFGSFLVLVGREYRNGEENPLKTENAPRPRFWLLAAVEWSIFVTLLLWFGLIALGLG